MCCELVFEIWTYLCSETSCWRRREKISLTERVKVLHRVQEDRNVLQKIIRREGNWIAHILLSKCLLNTLLKERRRKELSDGKTKEKTSTATGWRWGRKKGYYKLKEEALDRTGWSNGFGRGCGPV